LKEMSWKIGTVSAECLSESDAKKMREYVEVLENRIDELERQLRRIRTDEDNSKMQLRFC
jgi:chaperonin cofactor prefoldin